MNDQYASWSRGPHHGDARCVDCHLPHEFIGKYLAKAENGYHHSKGFTLQDFHEPILIKPRNAQILQDNCLRCHGDFVHDVLLDGDGSHPGDARVPGETTASIATAASGTAPAVEPPQENHDRN